MSKINVLVVPSDTHGVGKYRSIDPHVYLQKNHQDDYHVDIVMAPPVDDDEYYKKYQIVHFHSFLYKGDFNIDVSFQLTLTRMHWCKANGIKTVVDIDDYWTPDQYHPLYHIVKERKDNVFKTKILKEADYVTTTTPLFADNIKRTLGIKNVLVIPNAIDPNEQQFQPKPTASDLVRFGWLGGSTHIHDLELMRNNIASAHYQHKGNIQFVLCGFDLRGQVTEINKQTGEHTTRPVRPEETSWYQYENFFTDDYRVLPPAYKRYLQDFRNEPYEDINMPYRRRWTQPINSYAENYNTFDISLAPLRNSTFNYYKSQLKVIEAGFFKKPLIGSAYGPFTLDLISAFEKGNKPNPKGNALVVEENKNHKQWLQHINRLMASPALREDLGEKLYETVKDKYSLLNTTMIRHHFYQSLL